mgnify:CR=1 FL=1
MSDKDNFDIDDELARSTGNGLVEEETMLRKRHIQKIK